MRRRSAGFTLIELMVVVAIIVVLIIMLLPTLAKAKEESLLVKCQANLHAIGIAMADYNQQNKDLMPQSDAWRCVDPSDVKGNYHLEDRSRGWLAPGAAVPPSSDIPNSYLLLSWPESLYIDGDVATGSGDKGGVLSARKTGDDPTNGGSWHYPICHEVFFQCPKHPVDQRRGDDPSQWGYGMAWCATSFFKFDVNGLPSNNTVVLGGTVLVHNRDLVPNHIAVVDAEIALGRDGGWSSPATNDFGVFQRHKRNQRLGANYLMADYHTEWSDTYALTPSPVDFRSNYGTAARAAAAKQSFIWSHGVSAQR
jgi:prepilin-type N-terminal cleavage/methylation domain-containing protein